MKTFHQRPDLLPSIGTVIGATLWGLFWIPLRAVQEAGVSTIWTSPVVFACLVIAFLPIAIWRRKNFFESDAGFWKSCMLAGAAFTFYAISLHLTEVVRAMLLFYTTPIWSTLLGMFFLGERLTANRLLALALGIGGLAVILGAGDTFPWPRNMGDWFALASGFTWSIASVQFFKGGAKLLIEKTYAFAFCALCISLVLVALPLDIESGVPKIASLEKAWIWLLVMTVFLLPTLYLTVWPTTVLSPARVGILFMFEAIVGVGSAALLTTEPFGLREITGTLLVMSAAFAEVMRPQQQTLRG